jgi:hypothetical protein
MREFIRIKSKIAITPVTMDLGICGFRHARRSYADFGESAAALYRAKAMPCHGAAPVGGAPIRQ